MVRGRPRHADLAERRNSRGPAFCGRSVPRESGRSKRLDAEALSTPAFTGNIGIAEAKSLIQPFLDEIDLRAINEGQAGLIHHNLSLIHI